MTKPFTGTLSEQSAFPFGNHSGWDYQPVGSGNPVVPEKGESMIRNEAQRLAQPQDSDA